MYGYTDWQQEVLSNQESSLANQEKMISQNRVSQMINIAGFYTVSRKLDAVNRSVGEVRDAIQDMQRRTDVQLTAMNSTLRQVENSIAHYGEIATHQRYAQWRDGNEVGQHFHYKYRPAARQLLLNYQSLSTIWMDLVLRAVKQEVDAFPSWKRSEWKSDSLTTGMYFDRPELPPTPTAPPQLKALEQPIPYPESAKPLLQQKNTLQSGVKFIIWFFGLYLLSLPILMVAFMVATIWNDAVGTVVGIVLGAIALLLLVQLFQRRRRAKERQRAEIDAENARRRDYVDGFYAHVEGWKAHSNRLLASWELKNEEARQDAHRMLCERVGVELNTDFSDAWALPADTARVRMIAGVLASATERPPARDELPPLTELHINPPVENRYGRALRAGFAQLTSGGSAN